MATRVVLLAAVVALLSAVIGAGIAAPASASPARGGPAPAAADIAVAAASAASAPAPGSTGYRHGLVPTVPKVPAVSVTPPTGRSPTTANPNLVFGGGSSGVGVTTGAPKVYLVFWGSLWGTQSTNAQGYVTFSGDPLGMAPDLQGFMSGLGTGSETWSGVMTQYCDAVAPGAASCPASAAHVGYPTGGALAGVWADTGPGTSMYANAHDLAVEAVNAANHFGNTTQESNRNTQYFVVSATGTHPDQFNLTAQYCAWHDVSNDPYLPSAASPFAVAFTNMPYVSDAGTACGWGFVNSGAAGALDGATIVAGHEYAETITDQFPPGGWVNSAGYENGDLCAWIPAGSGQGALQNITLTTGSFPVQSTWANDYNQGAGGCEVSHSIVTNNFVTGPAITSSHTVSFVVDTPWAFTVTTTGSPTPAISETGPLPSGVSFTDHHDGSATLTGTPVAGTAGIYPLTVTSANGTAINAVQRFTLTVNEYGTIVNFAGLPNGAYGGAGDGGPANSATLYFPKGVDLDPAGNVYLVDSYNNRVRKVDTKGTITDLAGKPDGVAPGAGNSGDGGPATAATLFDVGSVAADSAGNVYIADLGNSRVRKVDSNGIITNFAGNPAGIGGNSGDGGPATSASLEPSGVAADSAGNVYIADVTNNRVRKVDTNGIITNFAGSPTGIGGNRGDAGAATSATLNGPAAIAADRIGNVYIADTANSRVRKVDSTGAITNFAGSPDGVAGSPGNTGDGGPAVAAGLSYPTALAADSAGNVYIADANNMRIRKVNNAGVITNFAGSPARRSGNGGDGAPAISANLYVPSGVAVDLSGNVYIADTYNNRVREVLAATAPPIVSAATATFTVGVTGTFTVTTTGFPTPTVTESGPLPPGVSFAVGQLEGIPAVGTVGNYPITFSAISAGTVVATQNFTLTVNQAPAFTNPTTMVTFTVGIAGSFTVTTSGEPAPAVTRYGMLPSGLKFDPATATLSGTPNQGTVGVYGNNFFAINGAHPDAVESVSIVVNQATMTYPTDGQANIDTTVPFTWTTIPQAQGYYLIVGKNLYGGDLVNSGVLPPTQSSFNVPALPAGATLHATLYAEVNRSWNSYQAITFIVTANPGQATFTFPAINQAGIDPTRPFTWLPIAHAQGYYLIVGTTVNGTSLVNSGVIPSTQSTYKTPTLPAGRRLYATLYSAVNGTWRYQSITFTTGPAAARFTSPRNGQSGVITPTAFTWSPIVQAQGYYLTVGTTATGTDLVSSGVISPSQTSFNVASLPRGKTLYATLYTRLNGAWTGVQQVAFSVA